MPTAFKTLFKDYVCPQPSTSGSNVAQRNGASIPEGQKRTSGSGLPEVTFTKVEGGPGIGESLGLKDVSQGSAQNAGKK